MPHHPSMLPFINMPHTRRGVGTPVTHDYALSYTTNAPTTIAASGIYNDQEGVIFIDYTDNDPKASTTNQRLFTLNDNSTTNNYIDLYFGSTSGALYVDMRNGGGAVQIDAAVNSGTFIGANYKVAIRYGANLFEVYVNGVKRMWKTTGLTFPSESNITSFNILRRFSDGTNANTDITTLHEFRYYDTAKTEDFVRALTRINDVSTGLVYSASNLCIPILGQSNAVGQATASPTYVQAIKNLALDSTVKAYADPYMDTTGSVWGTLFNNSTPQTGYAGYLAEYIQGNTGKTATIVGACTGGTGFFVGDWGTIDDGLSVTKLGQTAAAAIERIRQAMQVGDVDFIIFHQGEDDADEAISTATYKAYFLALKAEVEAAIGRTFNWVQVQLHEWNAGITGISQSEWQAIQTAKVQLANENADIYLVDTSNLAGQSADRVHMTDDSNKLAAARITQTIIENGLTTSSRDDIADLLFANGAAYYYNFGYDNYTLNGSNEFTAVTPSLNAGGSQNIGTTGRLPALVTGVNSLPSMGVRADGLGFIRHGYTAGDAQTVFMLGRVPNQSGGNYMFSLGTTANGSTSRAITLNSSNNLFIRDQASAAQSLKNPISNPQDFVIAMRWNSTTSLQIWINNTISTVLSIDPADITTLDRAWWGALQSSGVVGTVGSPIGLSFAAFAHFERALLDEEVYNCMRTLAEYGSFVPAQVGTVTPTIGNAQVSLAWSAPANGGSAITDYIVQYSTDNTNWTTFSDGTSASTGATVTGLTNGTLYYFRVAAVNANGTGLYSSSISVAPATVPSQVTGLSATPGVAQVALTWSAPAANGSAITDYKVEYKAASSGTWLTFSDGVSTSTSATVTGLTNGTSYDFRVSATNAVGYGSVSSTTTATPFSAFDSDYQAVLDRATTLGYSLPSSTDQQKGSDLVAALKTAGVWSRLDVFYVFAKAGTSQFATLNWKAPSANQVTLVNSPTFSSTGFNGDGVSAHLSTNFTPSTQGVNYTKDDASRFLWIGTAATGSVLEGNSSNSNRMIASNTAAQRINQSNSNLGGVTNPDGTGLRAINRTTSTDVVLFNGTTQTNRTCTSVASDTNVQLILRAQSTYATSALIVSAYGMGANLVSQNTGLNNALATFMA